MTIDWRKRPNNFEQDSNTKINFVDANVEIEHNQSHECICTWKITGTIGLRLKSFSRFDRVEENDVRIAIAEVHEIV